MSIFVFLLIMIGVLAYYYTNSNKWSQQSSLAFSIVFQIVFVLIIIIALALTYKIFENNFRNQTGILGFMIDLLFYLPCLFIDFIQYIGKEIKTTPNIIFILFIIELLLILAYYYIPRLIQNNIFSNEILLLDNTTFLNKKNQLADNSDLLPIITTNSDTGIDIKNIRQIYTISFWIYINQQYNRESKNPVNIFSYGSPNQYKPQMSYKGNNTFHVTFSGTYENGYNLVLGNQKWHQIVINYNESSVDLYVNGILERSFDLKGKGPKYLSTDVVTVGDDNGLDGAICNVSYYTIPLTNNQIVNTYNILMNKNPPINT